MIDYREDWLFLLLFQRKGSVSIRACFFAIPCAVFAFCICLLDDMDWKVSGNALTRYNIGLMGLTKSQLWAASTFALSLLLSFRTNRAMARFWEGTGLLHQMRGEWFDSVSCCVTFSCTALSEKEHDVCMFRHTLVRLMSLCHGSALEEIAGDGGEEVETIDPFGLDTATLEHLNACKHTYHFNRVEVLLHMTQTVITKASEDGILKVPAPILSRVYQTLSRGFVNLLNAKKIQNTRFPFPYAHLIAVLLAIHMLVTPVLMASLIHNKIWAAFFSFLPMYALSSINLIGIELENPFGNDPNDLPLNHFQGEMNKCLLMLLHSSADIAPTVDAKRCIFDFSELLGLFGKDNETMTHVDSKKSLRISHFQEEKDEKDGALLSVLSVSRGVGTPLRTPKSKHGLVKTSLDMATLSVSGSSLEERCARSFSPASTDSGAHSLARAHSMTISNSRPKEQCAVRSSAIAVRFSPEASCPDHPENRSSGDFNLEANGHSPSQTPEDLIASRLRTNQTKPETQIPVVRVSELDESREEAASSSAAMYDCRLKGIETNTR